MESSTISTFAPPPAGPRTFGVIGLGYVGLPLAVEVAASGGYRAVIGFDVAPAVVEGVNAGRSHIGDVPSAQVARHREAGVLEATTDMARLAECDVISICVPTPLSKTRDPDLSMVVAAGEAVAAAVRPGQTIVLESTTYPGTTRDVLKPLIEDHGLDVGSEVFLCFSPERVDPGNRVWTTRNTPKVMGGVTPACVAAGTEAYQPFIETLVPVSSPEAAELVKLLENTFRAVNIGLVNETAQIADRLGVDIWEVVEAAATKPFGFMKFTPGPGLGGHCIPVDPHYLSWKMRTLDYRARFIELASEVNAEMPHFVVAKVQEALNQEEKSVKGSRILVLGVAYKPDIADVRESPAIPIMRRLMELGGQVRWHDPHVEALPKGVCPEARKVEELTPEALAGVDCVVIVTDHSVFDLTLVWEESPVLVDTRNATGEMGRRDGRGHAQGWIARTGASPSPASSLPNPVPAP